MINPPWLFDAHSLVPTTFAVSMKSSMNIATRLAAVTIDDAPSVKGIQLELQPTCAHEKRSCLSPKFPVELECMIYSYLSVRDLKNLTRAYPRSSHIIADNNNSRQIARKMIARDSQRLRDQIEYLNFSGMSLVTAFRRWIQKYGLSRRGNCAPRCIKFSCGYFNANPGLHRNVQEVKTIAEFALMVSDWLQYYEKGTACTLFAHRIEARFTTTPNSPNWRDGLRALCLASTQELPEAYRAFQRMWKKKLMPSYSPENIILMFEEVRARPLVDLSECPRPMPSARVPQCVCPDDAIERICKIPQGLLEPLNVPKTSFGLSIRVRTFTKKGRRLLKQFRQHGDDSGLLLAELMKELKIVWD